MELQLGYSGVFFFVLFFEIKIPVIRAFKSAAFNMALKDCGSCLFFNEQQNPNTHKWSSMALDAIPWSRIGYPGNAV